MILRMFVEILQTPSESREREEGGGWREGGDIIPRNASPQAKEKTQFTRNDVCNRIRCGVKGYTLQEEAPPHLTLRPPPLMNKLVVTRTTDNFSCRLLIC